MRLGPAGPTSGNYHQYEALDPEKGWVGINSFLLDYVGPFVEIGFYYLLM